MERINFNGKTARKVAGGLLLLATIMLTACNGASGDGAGSTGTSTGQGTNNASGPVSIAVGLSPAATVSLGAQTTATATLLDSAGKPIADALITFSTDSKLATLTPSSGKVLTNSEGKAVISLTAASVDASGAGTLQVDATGAAGKNTFTVTGVANYSIGNSSIALAPIVLGQTTIDAYATTSIKVKVLINGQPATTPQTVTFTSSCASSKKAKLDSSAITINGEASATYTDDGCSVSDAITASLNIGSQLQQATIKINPRNPSTLKFVKNTPADGVITLKGFGSDARPQTAQVEFQLVDENNNGIANQPVTFSLDVQVGGVTLQKTSDITKADGKVSTTVIAGNQPTPVRVIAKTATLSSQSSGLSITTGFPDMDSLSLSADRHNINGWNYDGATSTITIRMADHFNNPIPDGTAVNFIADGGRIGDGKTTGQCQTKDSQCSIVLNSQSPRPNNGRVHIVAYALGEESFVDKSNNIIADQDNELVDINGRSSDIGEAFINVNENFDANGVAIFDQGIDQLVDFNGDQTYNGPDGAFNGMLCLPSWSKCSSKKSLHVYYQQVFIFASDKPLLNTVTPTVPAPSPADNTKNYSIIPHPTNPTLTPPAIRSLVLACGSSQTETFWIRESNAENAMPSKTAISYNTKDAGSTGTKAVQVPNSTQPVKWQIDGITIFRATITANKCSDMKDDSVKGTWGVSIAVPDHGGGSTLTTDFEAGLCVYNTGKASACN